MIVLITGFANFDRSDIRCGFGTVWPGRGGCIMTAGVNFFSVSSLMGVVIGAAAVLGFMLSADAAERKSRKKSQKRNKMEILFFWL